MSARPTHYASALRRSHPMLLATCFACGRQRLLSTRGTCAGNTASVILMVTYLVAIHNNSVLLLAAGLPFDRALPWHKLLAFSSLFNSLIHMAAYYIGRHSVAPNTALSQEHHIYTNLDRAYGMEITGAPLIPYPWRRGRASSACKHECMRRSLPAAHFPAP